MPRIVPAINQNQQKQETKASYRWIYTLFGPTTVHLKHELYIWISLSILSASSLQSLYRNSFGSKAGDQIYCLLAATWLARHLILRYVYTNDISTIRSPTFLGVINHWLSSLVVAGQYFDRSDLNVVAKNVGVANVENNNNNNNNNNSVANNNDQVNIGSSIFSLPSVCYTLQYIRVSLIDPLGKLTGQSNFLENAILVGNRSNYLSIYNFIHGMLSHPTAQRIGQYGPPLQLILSASVFATCIFYLQNDTNTASSQSEIGEGLHMFALTMQPANRNDRSYYTTRDAVAGIGDITAKGAYEPLQTPSWYQVFFLMSCISTMLSIFFYGRISFPIPDLVAGTNVLKAVRNEARGTTGKSKNSKVHNKDHESLWAEVYKSISCENRFRLACKVILLRIIDALICCVALPRTVLVCRTIEHCPARPTLSELSKILYPAGISAPSRDDGSYGSMFETINPDRGSLMLNMISVVLITSTLLLAQLVTLNKSYLAIMGHLAGEWKLVKKDLDGKELGSSQQWDPRRRYKKGDLIIHSYYPGFRQSVYIATTNSPEGRPFDSFLRATHNLFQNELGHSSTSGIVALCAKVHFAFMGIILLLIFYYLCMGHHESALLTILLANIVASYGLLSSGLMSHRELRAVAAEINNFD